MLDVGAELLAEVLSLVGYAVAAGLLTGLGVLAELTSLSNFAAGHLTVAAWMAFMGTVALYAGVYQLGYRRLLVRVLAAR